MFALLILSMLLNVALIRVAIYMAWDHGLGCFTRPAFNILYPILKLFGYKVLVGDINGLKKLNIAYGHEVVNVMIKSSLRAFYRLGRWGDFVFRIYSGDEFFIVTRSKDTNTMITRLEKGCSAYDISITVTPYSGNVKEAMKKVIDLKESTPR